MSCFIGFARDRTGIELRCNNLIGRGDLQLGIMELLSAAGLDKSKSTLVHCFLLVSRWAN